jgi:hypothetical protein
MVCLKVGPAFDVIRAESRFQALLKRVNLVDSPQPSFVQKKVAAWLQ